MHQVSNYPYQTVWRWGTIVTVLLLLLWFWSRERPLQASPTLLSFSPPEGYYQDDLAVTINSPETVLFTTDGTMPTLENGQQYKRPIRIRPTAANVTILTARLLLPDGTYGPIQRATYFTLESHLPILSVATDPDNLWHEQHGLYTHPEAKGREWERPAEVTYLESATTNGSRQIGFHAPAGMRIHGNSSRLFAKKSIRLYFRRDYGLSRLDYPLLPPLNGQQANTRYQSFVVHNGGQDFARPDWTLLRAHLVSDLAGDIGGYAAQTQPVLYFLNGELQGIYNIRNHFSPAFFRNDYGFALEDEVMQAARWDDLWQFMAANDLAEPANYAYVQSQIDIANFIDYNVLQFYIANTDWVFTNADIFRANTLAGRWQWAFWDVDWSFGLVQWGGYEYDTVQWFFTGDRPGMERGALPLRRLLQNPVFRQQFLSRTADLLNTTLTPAQMTARLERLAAELRPDIAYEVGRWPTSSAWEGGVAYMFDFVRYRPDYLRQQLVDYFDLPGTAVFRVAAPSEGKGRVAVNGILMLSDWKGVYFQGTEVGITAVPEPGYRFIGWQDARLPPDPNLRVSVKGDQIFTPRFAPADPAAWQPGDVQITAIDHETGLVELLVARRGGLDIRGWLLTDNDAKSSNDEGIFTFPNDPALAGLSAGTRLTLSTRNTPPSLNALSTTGPHLQATNLHLAPNDNLALLTPDGRGIDFVSWGLSVTPYAFGVLQDGITAVSLNPTPQP